MVWIFFDVISITILKIKIIVKNIALRANKNWKGVFHEFLFLFQISFETYVDLQIILF